GVGPDLVCYNAAVSACSQSRRWEEALALLAEMRGEGIEPDSFTFCSAMT
ncbi:unnamed protein product, partial [Discosporangium mesarthrocarpum]